MTDEKQMTKEVFVAAMQAEQKLYVYSKFESVPEHLRDPEMAEIWMDYAIKNTGHSGDLALEEITNTDLSLVSDSLRYKAISHNPRALLHIRPEHTPEYRELVLHCIGSSSFGFMLLDERFKTADLVHDVFLRHPQRIDLRWNAQDWVGQHLTPEMRESLIQTSFSFALSVELEVTPDQWTHLLKTQPKGYLMLEEHDRLELLDLFLMEGHWPDASVDYTFEPVSTAAEAAKHMLNSASEYRSKHETDHPGFLLYSAKLRRFPIKDVIKALSKPETMDFLFMLYPESELRKHMRHDRALRGRLLEEDLGM
jgi:hypothetical protein